MRLKHIDRTPVSFFWNGKSIEAREGDSAAAALYAAGIRTTGWSRKFHRPLGLSGPVIGGILARVDGIPNVRLDQTIVAQGMRIEMQNVWPSPKFNLFRFARLIPRHWIKGGFEHSNLIPSGTKVFQMWERFLGFVAGVADPASPSDQRRTAISGTEFKAECVVIGAGPAGCAAANQLSHDGIDVLLVSRGPCPGRSVAAAGGVPVTISPQVRTLWGVEVFGAYRNGTLLLGAPPNSRAGAVVIRAPSVVLATGKRSLPPLVPGAWLPGVLDGHTAMDLAFTYGVAPGKNVVVVGDGQAQVVADRLATLGVKVIGVYPLRQLRKIIGHSEIRAVETFDFGRLNCDALVYVGPAAADGSLQFQSGSDGQFQLTSGPTGYTVLDSADDTAALKIAATCPPSHATLICPCMDVSSKDVADLVAAGEHDLEVIKRLTSCGMGPCQGVPCWHSLKAFVCASTGKDPSELPLPTLRPPRRAMTVAQAAGLAELVDPLK